MRKPVKAIVGASMLMAGGLAVPVLYAHEGAGSMAMRGAGSADRMGGGSMMGGSGNMMGMMNMMGQMSGMAQHCGAMMTAVRSGAGENRQR